MNCAAGRWQKVADNVRMFLLQSAGGGPAYEAVNGSEREAALGACADDEDAVSAKATNENRPLLIVTSASTPPSPVPAHPTHQGEAKVQQVSHWNRKCTFMGCTVGPEADSMTKGPEPWIARFCCVLLLVRVSSTSQVNLYLKDPSLQVSLSTKRTGPWPHCCTIVSCRGPRRSCEAQMLPSSVRKQVIGERTHARVCRVSPWKDPGGSAPQLSPLHTTTPFCSIKTSPFEILLPLVVGPRTNTGSPLPNMAVWYSCTLRLDRIKCVFLVSTGRGFSAALGPGDQRRDLRSATRCRRPEMAEAPSPGVDGTG